MNKLTNLSDYQNGFVYRVENGDTLFSLAEKFHTTPSAIIFFNSLTNELQCGELVYIEKTDGRPYFVAPGDTLELIADKFGVQIDRILIKNKTDAIYVGQKIYI